MLSALDFVLIKDYIYHSEFGTRRKIQDILARKLVGKACAVRSARSQVTLYLVK